MIMSAKPNKRVFLANAVLAVIAVGIFSVSFTDVGKRLWFAQDFDSALRTDLLKPLRLQARQSNDFAEFLLALRTFHYRAQPRGVAVYSDVFYDTADWRLYRNGYSYRFRQRRGDGGRAIRGPMSIPRLARASVANVAPTASRMRKPTEPSAVEIVGSSWNFCLAQLPSM